MFRGLHTALITPFKNGKVDEQAFQSLVEWQISQGVHGLVPCGTTGETPTLSYEEHNRIVSMTVEAACGRAKVLAGTGSNSTDEAIMMTAHAKKAGADGVLMVAPYYNKPTQEGIYQHFKKVAESVEIPIILYNIPSRSIVDIKDETTERLAKLPNIVGIKDATSDLDRVCSLKARVGKDFCQLSGDDILAVAFNAQGGVGCVSVTANIVPKLCVEVQEFCFKGDFASALALHEKLLPLHEAMFLETNPTPIKYAASLMGKCQPDVRLPLVQPSETVKARIREVVKQFS